MARILGGGVFGQLRGKMGSLVFSRNRGGAYVRSLVKPTDPRTIAQLNARINFGTSSNNYHALDPSMKQTWKEFALNIFNSKTGTQGVPSGFNAFTALMNSVLNTNNMISTTYVVGGTPKTGTVNLFSGSNVPPSYGLEANFKNSSGGAQAYTGTFDETFERDDAAGITTLTGKLILDLTGGQIGPTGSISGFTDIKDNDFGFDIYMSSGVAQPGIFVNNPEIIKIGTIPGITQITPAVSAVETIEIQFSNELETASFKSLANINEYVNLTAYAISTTGMQIKVATTMVKVLAG